MLVAPPGRLATGALCAALLATSAFWTVYAARGPTAPAEATCHALMSLGMTTALLAMLTHH